jgi:hypothetical protein
MWKVASLTIRRTKTNLGEKARDTACWRGNGIKEELRTDDPNSLVSLRLK